MSRPFIYVPAVISALILLLASCGGRPNPGSPTPSSPAYQLTVTPPPAGTGSITSTPQGINCPTTCSATFPQNTQVQLTANPASNYFFEGWSGGCAGTGSCSVSMTAQESVSAAFEPGVQLTVVEAGTGTGTVTSNPPGISCPSTCSASFPPNTQVTLSETPANNDAFASWNGGCTGAANCTLILNGSTSITADFETSSSVDGDAATAFIYVASNSSNKYQIEAYTTDSSGQLTPVSGSPFAVNARYMAGNGKYLFTTDGMNITSFSVAADGSITQVSQINANQSNSNNCASPASLFLDRTGTILYDLDYLSDCANNQYQSFTIDSSSGALKFLNITDAASPVFEKPLSFTGNNQFAYSASCYHYYQEIYGFQRNSDGSLSSITNLGAAPAMPNAPPGDAYCPWLAAADATNHLAVTLSAMNGSTFQADGATQIAAYTVDDSGNLSTSSTAADMPRVAVGSVNDMKMSPAGNYLAVAGTGLQIFNFNGANPVTQFTGLLTSTPIDQVTWDENNHLYAISNSAAQLFVFAVTSSGASQVPGSPYTIASPVNIAVLPGS